VCDDTLMVRKRISIVVAIALLVAFALLAIFIDPFFWALFAGGCVPWVQGAWQRRRHVQG
jgi:hypothetical protein